MQLVGKSLDMLVIRIRIVRKIAIIVILILEIAVILVVAVFIVVLAIQLDLQDPPPSHVVFLTSKYQPRYALFETERLIRSHGACIGTLSPNP